MLGKEETTGECVWEKWDTLGRNGDMEDSGVYQEGLGTCGKHIEGAWDQLGQTGRDVHLEGLRILRGILEGTGETGNTGEGTLEGTGMYWEGLETLRGTQEATRKDRWRSGVYWDGVGTLWEAH